MPSKALSTLVFASLFLALISGPFAASAAETQTRTASAGGLYNADKEIREATAEISTNPKSAIALERRAAAYNKLERWEDALKDLNQAIAIDAKSPTAYFHRGLAQYKLSRYAPALADLTKCIQLNPKVAQFYALRSSIYVSMEKYQLAWQDAQQAVKIDPKDPQVQLAYSRAAHHVKNHGASIAACTKAIAANPKNPVAWDNRGVTYLAMKSYQNAISDFTKAISLSPGEPKYWCHRGIVYCETGDYTHAISDLTKAIKMKPDYSLALFDRGVSYYRMGKYELAHEDIKMAIHYDPHYALAWQEFPLDPVKVPPNKEPMDEARDWYFRATSRLLIMHGSREATEIPQAIKDLRKYLDLAGWQQDLSQTCVLLTYVLDLRLGQTAQAQAILDEAQAKCDKNAWPYPVIAFLRGELPEADLLAQAKSHESETEARSCVALKHWFSNRRQEARPHMSWVKDHGAGGVVTYSLVLRELEKENPVKTRQTERFYDQPRH